MKLLRKTIIGSSGQSCDFHGVFDLLADMQHGSVQVTMGAWTALDAANRRDPPVDRTLLDIFVGQWQPEMAMQVIDWISTRPEWAGAEILSDVVAPQVATPFVSPDDVIYEVGGV